MRAADDGALDAARILVEAGVQVNARDNSKATALHLASEGGFTELVQLLIDQAPPPPLHHPSTAAPSPEEPNGITRSCGGGPAEAAVLAVRHGAQPSRMGPPFGAHRRVTPAATRAAHLRMVRALLLLESLGAVAYR